MGLLLRLSAVREDWNPVIRPKGTSRTRMTLFHRWALSGALSLLLVSPGASAAQDVELLGRLHGTEPPASYYELMARDPGAFQFQRALLRPGLGLRELPPVRPRGRTLATVFTPEMALEAAGGAQRAPVSGTYRFPLVLALFSDSPVPAATFSRTALQAEFWDGPQSNPNARGTIPDFYAEISRGFVTLSGTTFDWVRTGLTRYQVTAGVSALGTGARIGEFIVLALQSLDDGSLDWGQFDNDGPDGIPNSGDDDGYVDVLTVAHPTPGGECQSEDRNNRIWSHRWNLSSAAYYEYRSWGDTILGRQIRDNPGYVTKTPRAGGGFIRILDYTIQSAASCAGSAPNTIGVFAHELGHGFGLPDLYGVNASHAGIGNWGLMGTGSWGCNGTSPELPCHMSAWSKSILGWADVVTLAPGADLGTLTLPPVATSGTVYRIDSGDGSGEYLLLENRQRTGFDVNLYEPGLLVWHIDPVTIAARWQSNRINSDEDRLGVWLRQADGLDELASGAGGRGDADDPFPGRTGNAVFHAGSAPSSWTHDGEPMGVTLLDIDQAGSDMSFRALTRYQNLTVRTEGSPSGEGLISVDGSSSQLAEWSFPSAPFQVHSLTAAPGEEIGAGIRVGFQGWSDGAPRVRQFTTQLQDETFTALYGGREFHLDVTVDGPAPGIAPGSISFVPGDDEGWVPEGQAVVITANPRTGFSFREWTGALAGRSNPTTLTVSAPLSAGAAFDLTFSAAANPSSVALQGGVAHTVTLQVENANQPVTWTHLEGSFPPGISFDPAGLFTGAPLARGDFPLELRVRDAIGLEARISVTLAVDDPDLSAQTAASPFLLTGGILDQSLRTYLDRAGNANSSYDLGDLRAFLLRNPDLPMSADTKALIELVVPLGPLSRGGGDSRKEERQ